MANVVNTLVVPSSTKIGPYYDDFNEDKNYLRTLFRGGRAVQGRELTQVQTVLQNQIERFGQNIFTNGSSVVGGASDIAGVITLNLASTYANTSITAANFLNQTIRYASGNTDVIARVMQTSEATDTDPPSLYLKYLTGTSFGPGDSIKIDTSNTYANVVATSNASSNGLLSFIYDSIYFFNGFFIKVPTQSVVVSKYTPQANARIGLELTESIVTETSDSSLLDPALEASNYQAPGASRYQANLNLAIRDLDSVDDSAFVDIARVVNGVIVSKVDNPVYSEIGDELARRTYDESGNYTVKPFMITLQDNPNDSNTFQVVLSSGKAYIYGYEYQTISDTVLNVAKARTTQNVVNQQVAMNFGNYVYTDNVNGVFDISTMERVDLHCVPAGNVDFTTSSTYGRTKIGTARVRDVNFFGGDVLAAGRKFEFYFFSPSYNVITGNANTTISTTQIQLTPANSSITTNAYIGATITITAGVSAGDVRTITSYSGANNIATVSQAFSVAPTTASAYSLSFNFGAVESFVKTSQYTTGASSNANASISTISKSNGLANGITGVTEASLGSLIFSYPDTYLSPGISNETFQYRKIYTGVQFTSGNSTSLSSGSDTFDGVTASSNIASTVLNNFLVICTNSQGSGRANGEQIKVTTSITGSSPQLAVLGTSNTTESFVGTVYAKMLTSTGAAPRSLSLTLANVSTFGAGTLSNTFISPVTGSNTQVWLTNGQVIIQNPSKTVGLRQSLYISNIIAVPKIWDLNGAPLPAAGASLTGYADVTNYYTINDGQTNDLFDHGSIALRSGFLPPKGPLIVCVRYYAASSDTGYYSVDSYPNLTTNIVEEGVNLGTGYSIIPSFTDTFGNFYQRRDSIDFRPNRVNATNNNPGIIAGIKIPVAATEFTSNYQYYLGRRDLISLSSTKKIMTTTGTPSKYPQNPISPSLSMVMYVLSVPPYTLHASNVEAQYIDNRTYTMKDIGLLDKRLATVEYYIALNQLEANTASLLIKDVNGLDRTKQGILADSFSDASLSDPSGSDYHAGIDTTTTELVPETFQTGITLVPLSSSGVSITEDRVLLSYTVAPALTQNVATQTIPVADYLFAGFEGQLYTVPETDIWKSVTKNPDTLISTTTVNNNFTTSNVILRDVSSVSR